MPGRAAGRKVAAALGSTGHRRRNCLRCAAVIARHRSGGCMKKVNVYAKRRVFDSFFKIDEAEVSFERYDGMMSPRVKRLCFERGDSVAAMIWDRDASKAIFVEQFKYPTLEK